MKKESPPLLSLEGVVKAFRTGLFRPKVRALAGLGFRLEEGEALGLVGPNGSGKTTAFRLCAGLLAPDAGTLRIAGSAPGSAAARRAIGYMPELPGFPPTLTCAEVLRFLGDVFGMHRAEREARIRRLDAVLHLAPFLARRIGKLSKGMAKRAALACALLHDPKLLLLDEPFEGIDPLTAARMKDHLKERIASGCGLLISSHVLSDVEALCGRILILHEGRSLLQGETGEILAARDLMEVRYRAEDPAALLGEIRGLIESLGGSIESAGPPREGLEALFRRVLAAATPPEGEGGSAQEQAGGARP